MPTLLLIPSSRYVDEHMQLDVGRIPPTLIRMNGKLLLEMIADNHSAGRSGLKIICTVDQGRELVQEQLAGTALEKRVELLQVSGSTRLGKAISSALQQVRLEQFSELIINFGDTLVESDVPLGGTQIYFDRLSESYRWTCFKQSNGELIQISDKFQSNTADSNNVFCGLFIFDDPVAFRACLEQTPETPEIDVFYAALQSYLKNHKYRLIRAARWHDFGHIDNYYEAKKRFINSRYFNELRIDERCSKITKKSSHGKKLVGEIQWYLDLPGELRCFTPQVYDYVLSEEQPAVCLEYYGYPSLSDIYVSGAYDLGVWQHAFSMLFFLLEEMRKHEFAEDQTKIAAALFEMYCSKTRTRLGSIKELPQFAPFFANDIVINQQIYHSLEFYLERLDDLAADLGLLSLPRLSIIHGDLCLANLLYDPKNRIIKMIDPRGSFGAYTLYGDYRYDLAKLSHSFNGHYEFIINDCFLAHSQGSEIFCRVKIKREHELISALFNSLLQRSYPLEAGAIRLIEGLLFLSMLPYHSDQPQRQLAMLAAGVPIIHEALSGVK